MMVGAWQQPLSRVVRHLGHASSSKGVSRSSCRLWRRHAVVVTPERLEQFLTAEIAYMGRGGGDAPYLTVQDILALRQKKDVARRILEELPPRFAKRICDIEGIAPDWADISGMAEVHECLSTSFRRLRLVDPMAPNWLEHVHEVIVDLRHRHRIVVPCLAETAKQLRQRNILDDQSTDAWVRQFMMSRLGTEMLTKHYIDFEDSGDDGSRIGVVDTRCRPSNVCQEAIDHVRARCPADGIDFRLKVRKGGEIEIAFISAYMFYIVGELLKNSLKSILLRGPKGEVIERKVKVSVAATPQRVGIQISDKAGGVDPDIEDKIWKYNFTTFPWTGSDFREESSPLSGVGMGLPLCKLYAQYLGGSMHLMSMPGVGTDVYVYFNSVALAPTLPGEVTEG